MTTQECIKYHLDNIEREKAVIKWIEDHEDTINSLPGLSVNYGGIDFDDLPHCDVVKVMLAFPGTWRKTPSFADETKIDYTLTLDNGLKVRCWNGFPPESCRIEEVVEEVPAQPAHTRIVRKLVCV